MNLDIAVSRLKLLKANHISQQYRLENNILKHFPMQIQQANEQIEGLDADMAHLADHTPNDPDQFSMTIQEKTYTEKDKAGKVILEVCNQLDGTEPALIGQYRGFEMQLYFESFTKEYRVKLKNRLSYTATLGTDVFGNITRLNNALEGMPKQLEMSRENLAILRGQMESTKEELAKPFVYEQELTEKSARLAELNSLLNMDEKGSEALDTELEEPAEIPESAPDHPKKRVYEMAR
jgi:DNA repair ATPase RecN